MICDYNTFPTELLLLAIITITSSIAMYFRVKRWLDVLAGFIFDTAEFKLNLNRLVIMQINMEEYENTCWHILAIICFSIYNSMVTTYRGYRIHIIR